ncbi:MAG: SDR family oxidoreductase [Bacteroidota bacterium]|nr:SDR family oxidoreductase [Bacteroidota bacterium]
MKTKSKTIVVTGGGAGMGRAIVLELLGRGANVAAVDINESALLETKKLANVWKENLSTHVLNITDRKAVELLPGQIIEKHGQVDGLVNNAGIIQPFVKVNDLEYDVIERVMAIDFYGTLCMTKAFLPYFQKRDEAHLVNVSSMGGLFPVPGESIYGAAKAAVKLLTEGLQAELMNTNVGVTLICPGGIATDIKFNSGAEKTHMKDDEFQKALIKPVLPSKAAKIIVDAIEKNKKCVLIGTDIKALSVIYKLNPGLAKSLINKQMKSHIPE